MKVNAPMLCHHIQKYFNVEYMSVGSTNFVKNMVFFNTFFNMDKQIILVAPDNVIQCVERVNNSIILCLDHIDSYPDPGNNDLIVLNDAMSSTMAYNILTYILDYFNEWEINLTDIVYNHHDFQALIDSVNRIIELPVALFDSDYRYIAFSKDSNTDEYTKYVDADNHIPIDHVNEMNSSPDFAMLEGKTESFLFTGGETTVFRNIFHHSIYVARFAVKVNPETDDVDYCKSILNAAAPFAETLYDMSRNYAYISREYRLMHQYMDSIFNSKITDRDGFLSLLDKLRCKPDDVWRVYTLHLYKPELLLYSTSYTCFQIENSFPGCYCIIFNNSIICLTNVSAHQRAVNVDFSNYFGKYLKDTKLVGGVSRDFKECDQFENLYFAKISAEYAFENAPQLLPGQLAHFKDYSLEYMLRFGTNGLSAANICHPAVLTLMDHDKAHSTSFAETLFQYLQHNMNAVATAKVLFIHRSSFINRMERIHELTDIDLTNPNERLYLEVSFNRYYSVQIK
ncbi:MAG: helix-turn-helix domain-containing protein [Lachnospiraceae bacterium]|nr:helix-turn-helix domain-containing protein [Lachnospiraceae bacterium]